MRTRANVSKNETVVVTGASGWVGLAVVRLAQARGAKVIAIALDRGDDLVRRKVRKIIVPLIAETYALRDIAAAQSTFGEKGHIGKIVLGRD